MGGRRRWRRRWSWGRQCGQAAGTRFDSFGCCLIARQRHGSMHGMCSSGCDAIPIASTRNRSSVSVSPLTPNPGLLDLDCTPSVQKFCNPRVVSWLSAGAELISPLFFVCCFDPSAQTEQTMERVGVLRHCLPHRLQNAASASARPSLSNVPSWMESMRALSALGREAEPARQLQHIARGGMGRMRRLEMAPCVLSRSCLGVCRWFFEKWADGTPRSVPSCPRGSWRFRRSASPCHWRALVPQPHPRNTASSDSLCKSTLLSHNRPDVSSSWRLARHVLPRANSSSRRFWKLAIEEGMGQTNWRPDCGASWART
jgi:hypothetical protein